MQKLLRYGDSKVKHVINQLNLQTRPFAGPGIWLLFLLPISILATPLNYPVISESYNLACILCVGLLASCISLLLNIFSSQESTNVYSGLIFPFAITSFRLYFLHERGLMFSVYCGFLCSFAFSWSLKALMKTCSRCFTFGEAAIFSQSLILFLAISSESIYLSWNNTPVLDMDIATLILQVGHLGVMSISAILYKVPFFQAPGPFYVLTLGVLCLIVIPSLQLLLSQNPILWILSLIFTRSSATVCLVAYWLLCVGVAGSVVVWQIWKNEHASTALRKYFHILAVAVYFPGLIKACCLLYLASGVVLAVFVMLEVIRLLNIPPLGNILRDGFSVYADEKDAGNLALTPIYLLVGCSLPLWLHPTACTNPSALLSLSSGLLSIGIGDTLASTVGSNFGRHKWSGTRKTIEGTAACALGQFFTVIILHMFGVIQPTQWTWLILFISISTTSLVEAHTDQVDNLVLPMLNYLILQTTNNSL